MPETNPHNESERHVNKIIGLKVSNFKRLRAVEIRPNGKSVVIGGRNAQGKTSVLDALEAALAGGRAAPVDPVRHGETKARIVVELDGLTVTRRFTPKGSQLEVRGSEGEKLSSPQSVLDRLTGSLTFDPLAFSRQPSKDQAETLRALAGLDLTPIDEALEDAVGNRRVQKQALAQAKASAATHKLEDAPEAPIDVGSLLTVFQDAVKVEDDRREATRRLSEDEDRLSDLRDEAAELQKRIRAREEVLRGLPSPLDLDALKAEVDAAEETNRRVRLNDEARKAREAVSKLEDVVEAAEDKVAELRSERQEAIAAAEFPVEGLAVTEDGVTYNGVIFEQASMAEKIRVSTAVGLAMNPELRVLLVRDGSLLDDEALAEILTAADRDGLQLWVERVGNGEAVGVVIEDGEVADAV